MFLTLCLCVCFFSSMRSHVLKMTSNGWPRFVADGVSSCSNVHKTYPPLEEADVPSHLTQLRVVLLVMHSSATPIRVSFPREEHVHNVSEETCPSLLRKHVHQQESFERSYIEMTTKPSVKHNRRLRGHPQYRTEGLLSLISPSFPRHTKPRAP